MNNEPVAYENTDKEIWRAIPDDYYSPSIFVTKENNIGINVGGHVYVKTVEQWHKNTNPVKELKNIVLASATCSCGKVMEVTNLQAVKELTDEEIEEVFCSLDYGHSLNELARALLRKVQER